jgi:hypothetical protein
MSKASPIAKIPGIVLAGIAKASKNYIDASNGWLWNAPEYWVTTHIALELAKKIEATKRIVWLEHPIQKTISGADATNRGPKPKHLNGSKRFDVAVGYANETPRCVIEVKSPVFHANIEKCKKDINRLATTLSSGNGRSKLQSGIFALYADCRPPKSKKYASAGERLGKLFGEGGELHKKVIEHLASNHPKTKVKWHCRKIFSDDLDGARLAVVMEFVRAK